MANLNDLAKGETGRVAGVNDKTLIGRRLMEMGIVPGVSIRVVKSGPFDDPIEIRLLGYSLAIRRSEAAAVEIESEI